MKRILVALMLASVSAAAGAGESAWDVSANMDVQSRTFTESAAWTEQSSRSLQLALAGEVELRWRGESGRASFIPFARYDATDDERSIVDLREAYFAWEADDFELLIGNNTVFWGVTESVHLVDIINQTDSVADIDGEDKLGQPMVNLALQRDWGSLSFYALPYFRERTFPGVEGRFRPPVPVANDGGLYESAQGREHVDWALRYSHYVGDFDIGLSLFDGTSREPRLTAEPERPRLLPHYDQIQQFGIDVQFTRDAWLWKLEAIVRDARCGSFAAAVGGLEYTRYQVLDSSADLGLLLEYQYDGRDAREPFTIADNDVFAAARLALNDIQDTAILAGLAYDTKTGETFVNVEADRRLGQNYTLELRLRTFAGSEPGDATYSVDRDDYLQLSIKRFF